MKTEKQPIRIEIRIDRVSARRAVKVGGTLILFAVAGVAFGVPVTFSDGNVLTAKQLNDNFSNLETRLKAAEDRLTNKGTYSVGARFCGASAGNFTGDLGGFVGAATACRVTCAGSTTAHLCVADELIRSLATGMTVAAGWYTVGAMEPNGSDCRGWSTADSGVTGHSYTAGQMGGNYCNVSQPILCCD